MCGPRSRLLFLTFAAAIVGGVSSRAGPPTDERTDRPERAIDFDRDVRPILADKCYACHGPDRATRKAGLRLDQRDGVLTVATPSDADAGELVSRITAQSSDRIMPPPEAEDPLSVEQVLLLRAWIEEGASWKQHWAFEAPVRIDPPAVADPAWGTNEIDAFVLASLRARGLTPKGFADDAKLLRRVSFDLTGLPPTLDELDRFLSDERPDAYERAVERLLASPRYGEHMAQWWLDGARYADTNGYQNDFARQPWPWRDWVIAAFNENMPYDQFAVEQLAGDLLPSATLSQRVATGFNRNHRTVTEVGSIDEEWRVENVVDRVETTSAVFLGLTMGCARCHDHKYDPISQQDFYRFFAFFNNVAEQGVYAETRGNVPPMVKVPRASEAAELAAIDERLSDAHAARDRLEAAIPDRQDTWRAALRPRSPDASPTATLHVSSVPVLGDPAPSRSVAPHVAFAGSEGSYADLGQTVLLDHDAPFTVALWVFPNQNGAVYSKMADDDTYRGVDLLVEPGHTLVAHLIHDWPENAIKVETRQTVAFDRWTFLAITYDGSGKAAGVRIAIDGRDADLRVHSDTLVGTLRTDAPLRLGRRHYAPYFGGAIAELRFFDRVLSPAEHEAVRREHVYALLTIEEERTDDAAGVELNQLLRSVFADDVRDAELTIDALQRERDERERATPTTMVMEDLHEPRPTYVLSRGRYDAPVGDRLEPGLPAAIATLPPDARRDRLGLAEWIVSEQNPLTARVVVNQLWRRFFGLGLVETAENFGVQGARADHPELLDWLATELVRLDWDLKALQREIVRSSTYRQSSRATPEEHARDPQNRRLARGPRFRLSAEELRDQALLVSGLLVERIGGPPTRPYQPVGLWEELAGGAGQGPYVQDTGEGLYRRSLYTHRKRTVPHPSLSTFDAPGFEVCQIRRARTNTPLQALALLNDVTYLEAARALAERMMRDGGATARERIAFAFRALTARDPSPPELEALVRGLEARRARFEAAPEDATALLAIGDSAPDPSLDPATLAACTLTASVLLNLDETLTKE